MLLALAGSVTLALATPRTDSYAAEVASWRAEHEARLKADDGWLTVSGLFWLKAGLNRVGADPSNDIVLPSGSAPARLGVFEFDGVTTVFQAEPGTRAASKGAPVSRLEMRAGSEPDAIVVNDLTMFVIQRGERIGVRLRDKNAATRREFTRLRWFPVDPAYRVTARFDGHAQPRKIPIANVLGDTVEMVSPGFVTFVLGEHEWRLEPVLETPDAAQLFFIFGDATNGAETYPSGRFLYSALPRNGQVVLDFNRAENPPCAFTAFATCPLPPEQNRLPIRVAAGEMAYGHHQPGPGPSDTVPGARRQ
jgi:uncharacterized protein (DUF1684 family)